MPAKASGARRSTAPEGAAAAFYVLDHQIGFALRLIDAPVAPVMIGLILGPAADQHLRRALAISQGDWTVFFSRPLSVMLLLTAIVIAGWGLRRTRHRIES